MRGIYDLLRQIAGQQGVDVSRFPEVTPLGVGYIQDLTTIRMERAKEYKKAKDAQE